MAEVIASDPDLMRVLNRIEHTPNTNVLFAGVQYLMLRGDGDELREFYPNFSQHPQPLERIDGPFKQFVLDNEEELVEIGRTRYTQTNECRRCVALLPGVWRAPFDEFHLIDVGCSAGLNLALDHYRYSWGGITWGDQSPVLLETELLEGDPKISDFRILTRTGLDLNPVDPREPSERRWLEALVWPENHQRRDRLVAALGLIESIDINFVAGDAVDTLKAVLTDLPASEPAVVINSFAMNQFSPAMRVELESVVAEGRSTRPIHRVSFELFTSENEWAHLQVDDGSGFRELGHAHPHGEWVEFYA